MTDVLFYVCCTIHMYIPSLLNALFFIKVYKETSLYSQLKGWLQEDHIYCLTYPSVKPNQLFQLSCRKTLRIVSLILNQCAMMSGWVDLYSPADKYLSQKLAQLSIQFARVLSISLNVSGISFPAILY